MGTTFRWNGAADRERITETRMRCYGRAGHERENFRKRLVEDTRSVDGDFLLAEEALPGGGAEAVGTVTSLSLHMWMRGCRVGCQGIAWVGTVRTHRRQGKGGGQGIASQLMREALAKGRERGEVVSALMPFRASFYEHFGYGIVETRNVWTVPLSLLPVGSSEGVRYARPEDAAAMAELYQRTVESGQCNIERGEARWKQWMTAAAEDGFVAVDPAPGGTRLRGYLLFGWKHQDGRDCVEVLSQADEDAGALLRQLHFLANQRDQFASAVITLPADLPLPWFLRERQIAHRPVNHPVATVSPQSRMQIRVLDHARLLENFRLPGEPTGKATVCVKESEGHESRFTLDLHAGRVGYSAGGSGSGGGVFTCADHTWASIVSGTLRASTALQYGLAEAENLSAARTLDHLSAPGAGPMPFCQEYF